MKKTNEQLEAAKKNLADNKWSKAIAEARNLAEKATDYQMAIAKIALEVCEITHGGRIAHKDEGKYTLTRFAKETGINYRTLSNWVGIRKLIYDKVPKRQIAKLGYADMIAVARKIEKDTPAEKVAEVVQDYLDFDEFERRINRYACELRSLTYNFQKNGAAFRTSDEMLNEITFYCQSILTAIKRDRPHIKPKLNGKVKKNGRVSAARAVVGSRVSKSN